MIVIDTKHLKIGMYVAALDRPWEGTPFAFQGFPIKNENQILKLQDLCHTVQIDEDKSDYSIDFGPFVKTKKRRKKSFFSFFSSIVKKKSTSGTRYPQEEKPFEEEMAVAKQVYLNTSLSLQKIMDDFRLSKEVSSAEIKSCVHGIIDGVMNNPNALALLSNLRTKQQDSVKHSLNVAIICLLFGRHLGMDQDQLNELGYAGLLHDVGEIKIPRAILDKHQRRLSPEERKVMELHTTYGAEILGQNPEIPSTAAQVAHSHHERVDGRGYPRALKGKDIDYLSKIVSIVDVYESVTNNPTATIKISCSDALKSIYSMCDSYFDRELVEEFIKCLGIYPIGSVVQLNTKEIAIVVSIRPGKNLLPTVMIVIGSEGIAYYPPKMVNLDNFKNKDGTPQLYIVDVLTPESVGIDLSDYLIREAGIGR